MPGDIDRYVNVSAVVSSTIACIGVAVLVAALCYLWKGAIVAARAAGWLLLLGSVVVIFVITLDRWNIGGGPFPTPSNWVPFRDINTELHNVNRALGIVNVVGNVVIFVPTGFLAGLLFRPRWTAFLVAPVLSVCIELAQVLLGSSADIDDVILNSLGGTIGVAVAVLVRRLALRSEMPSAATAENPRAHGHPPRKVESPNSR